MCLALFEQVVAVVVSHTHRRTVSQKAVPCLSIAIATTSELGRLAATRRDTTRPVAERAYHGMADYCPYQGPYVPMVRTVHVY